MSCACLLQSLVDRHRQRAEFVVGCVRRAVDGQRDDDAGAGEVDVHDPVAEGPAFVSPHRSDRLGRDLLDAESVAGRVGGRGAGDWLAGCLGDEAFELALLAWRQPRWRTVCPGRFFVSGTGLRISYQLPGSVRRGMAAGGGNSGCGRAPSVAARVHGGRFLVVAGRLGSCLPDPGGQQDHRCAILIPIPPGARNCSEEASGLRGATTESGRPARTRRLMDQSAKPALPGSGATPPDAAQTALSRDQHGYGNIHHVTTHATSGHIALQ